MDKFLEALNKIIDFLERKFPWIWLGYKAGQAQSSKTEAELNQTKLNLEYQENENELNKNNAGKSDSDIIRDAIESERIKSKS